MCALPSLQKRHVAIARLKHAANMGRNSHEVRFFIMVLTPSKEVSSPSFHHSFSFPPFFFPSLYPFFLSFSLPLLSFLLFTPSFFHSFPSLLPHLLLCSVFCCKLKLICWDFFPLLSSSSFVSLMTRRFRSFLPFIHSSCSIQTVDLTFFASLHSSLTRKEPSSSILLSFAASIIPFVGMKSVREEGERRKRRNEEKREGKGERNDGKE